MTDAYGVCVHLICTTALLQSGFVGWTSFTINTRSAKEFYGKVEGLFGQDRSLQSMHLNSLYMHILTISLDVHPHSLVHPDRLSACVNSKPKTNTVHNIFRRAGLVPGEWVSAWAGRAPFVFRQP